LLLICNFQDLQYLPQGKLVGKKAQNKRLNMQHHCFAAVLVVATIVAAAAAKGPCFNINPV
jgi:hypothetical protein